MQHGKKAAFLTLGCKVNQYETDAMKEILEHRGWEIVDFSDTADVYIINTCSVTNVADRKSRQMIRRAKRKNPEAVVVAAGCYVQHEDGAEAVRADVDLMIGNNRKKDVGVLLESYFMEKEGSILNREDIVDIMKEDSYEDLSLTRVEGHTRAYLKIQDGCNRYCSYCIIPYVRGRIRSRNPQDVIREVRGLANAGFKEVVLTGIHLSSYGKDLGNTSLVHILKELNQIQGIERIRLGSLEPRIITEDFVKEIAGYDKVCPHFHLSLQSGCDQTLKRMNRKYTTAEYEEALDILRKYYQDPACTTDVIAGFVGETEEEFEKTYQFLEKIRLYEMHIFKYSVRKGTRAEKMEGHLPEHVKGERSDRLIHLAARLKKEYEEKMIGRIDQVLLEEEVMINGEAYIQGFTSRYVKVAVKLGENSDKLMQNTMVKVEIIGFICENLLEGKVRIDL